jgi:hypothetical protein
LLLIGFVFFVFVGLFWLLFFWFGLFFGFCVVVVVDVEIVGLAGLGEG